MRRTDWWQVRSAKIFVIVLQEQETEDYAQGRKAWRVMSWIFVVMTIVLNLLVIGILLVRQNAYTVVNKGQSTIL